MNIYFGENLKRLRMQRNLTQEALAKFFDVSFQTISKWEHAATYPDITLLPDIAEFFGVGIEELLGINKSENEKKIAEYLDLFETMHGKQTPELLCKYQCAVREFPNDFRILVRYMQLLVEEKTNPYIKVAEQDADALSQEESHDPYKLGLSRNPEYDLMSAELMSIYNRIQEQCTDDSVRIRSKHILFDHLMNRYETSFDRKTGKWRSEKESLGKAEAIAATMPALCDARECVELRLCKDADEFAEICRRNIEELSYLLQENIRSYCYYPYNNDFSAEYKIKVIEHMNGIFKMVDGKDHIGKNRVNLIYNYGHLGHLYFEIGNREKAFAYLRACAERAKELDAHPVDAEKILRFYDRGSIREMNMRQRMKELMTKHYPIAEELKNTDEFKEIIALLES